MRNTHPIARAVGSVLIALVFAVTLHGQTAQTDLTVASPFTDNAVLQRDMAVPVWGTADAGATVTVKFGVQNKSAVAADDGHWKVLLDAMPANVKPQKLDVSAGEDKISFSNVVVGEVWICSGQSNMQWPAARVPAVKALTSKAKNLRTFEVNRTVAMTQQDRLQGQWVEGPPSSAVAFSFAYFLEQAADVPVGIILTCWGSSSLEAWMPRDMTETVPHFKTMMEEFDANTEILEKINSILNGPKPWKQKDDIFLRRQTNILYNAMMNPLVPYGCRGLVWYQGERNAGTMFGMPKKPVQARNSGMLKYGDTLKAWIKRYRQGWGNDQMEFMIVMLPGYYKPMKSGPDKGAQNPAAHSWAWMRESQLKVLDLPHTAVINTVDLGREKNIHPPDKLPVGKRLALMAARETLGQDVEAQGPVMKKVDVEDGQLLVRFDHAKGLKTVDGQPPTGFWIANDSKKWVKATAELEGETVVLSSPEIKQPQFVRYAFSGKPKVNLVNSADLPAYPFRTDTFKP